MSFGQEWQNFSLLSQNFAIYNASRPVRNIQKNDLKQCLTGSLGCSADLYSQFWEFFLLSSLSHPTDSFLLFFSAFTKEWTVQWSWFYIFTIFNVYVQAGSSSIILVFTVHFISHISVINHLHNNLIHCKSTILHFVCTVYNSGTTSLYLSCLFKNLMENLFVK